MLPSPTIHSPSLTLLSLWKGPFFWPDEWRNQTPSVNQFVYYQGSTWTGFFDLHVYIRDIRRRTYQFFVVYFETRKWDLNKRLKILLYECRREKRLKDKTEGSTSLTYTGLCEGDWNTYEVNNRDVCECDGWVWELDVIDTPSRLRVTRKSASFPSRSPHFDFSWFRNAMVNS
jgi:hypothetical protein